MPQRDEEPSATVSFFLSFHIKFRYFPWFSGPRPAAQALPRRGCHGSSKDSLAMPLELLAIRCLEIMRLIGWVQYMICFFFDFFWILNDAVFFQVRQTKFKLMPADSATTSAKVLWDEFGLVVASHLALDNQTRLDGTRNYCICIPIGEIPVTS